MAKSRHLLGFLSYIYVESLQMKAFNHFKSLVVMKKNLLFTMSVVLLMAGMVTTACSSDDDDVHSSNFCNFIVVNFWEHELFFNT